MVLSQNQKYEIAPKLQPVIWTEEWHYTKYDVTRRRA